MALKLIVLAATVIASIECKQSYILKRGGWKNEMEKCASGGDENRTKKYIIGDLPNTPRLTYKDIRESTTVDAHGYFELLTSTGREDQQTLHLTEYYKGEGYKQFSQVWTRATTSGLASQMAKITLTVMIHILGMIILIIDVQAGSKWAVSCATSKAFVGKIEIIN